MAGDSDHALDGALDRGAIAVVSRGRRRDRPSGGRVLVYLHGGGYFSGGKQAEGRALLRRFASAARDDTLSALTGDEEEELRVASRRSAAGMLCTVMDRVRSDFELFVADVEPRLRRALVASFGAAVGREAAADALAWAWQHWERVSQIENAVGYLYRVGRTLAARGGARDVPVAEPAPAATWPGASFEPGLAPALARLSEVQRSAVVLVVGFGYTLREAAEVLGVTASTVHRDCERALARLRSDLEVENAR
jgi:DNA-directed RNA polymerase specialized sigma24 family protein